jgi:hypothetical protein
MSEELLQTAKPILFNTEMVRAILDGRKTVSRRVVPKIKGKPNLCYCDFEDKFWITLSNNNELQDKTKKIYSKYNKGDVLYVRETFTEGWRVEDYSPNNEYWFISDTKVNNFAKQVFYKSILDDAYCDSDNLTKWKPSIHMPKEYARIFLKVTNVRVERLQDMEHDYSSYEAEGLSFLDEEDMPKFIEEIFSEWVELWNSTAKGGYKWEDNPYVFVYEFERIEV